MASMQAKISGGQRNIRSITCYADKTGAKMRRTLLKDCPRLPQSGAGGLHPKYQYRDPALPVACLSRHGIFDINGPR
jgi:hypothetical protein